MSFLVSPCRVALATALSLVALQAQRDQRGQLKAGTASISGTVVTTDRNPQPVRRAIVSLYLSGDNLGRHLITDEDGNFSFEALPDGRYEISASRPSFVPIAFGAKKVGRPGAPIFVASGQQVSDVRVLLARGAVITGKVRDNVGFPMPDLEVRLQSREGATVAVVRTDDQGDYRAFGLAAGTYFVSARPPGMGTNERLVPSDAEIDEAIRNLHRRSALRGPVSASVTQPKEFTDTAGRVSDFVPVYYPSAFLTEEATPITVAVGEERAGIDVLVRMMSTSIVAGRIVGANRPQQNVEITMTKAGARSGADAIRTALRPEGTFQFSSVLPGRYLLAVRIRPLQPVKQSTSAQQPGAAFENRQCLSAVEELVVAGTDRLGLSLDLRPCLRIEGRIRFADSAKLPKPSGVSSLQVVLQSDSSAGSPSYVPVRAPAKVSADGSFVLGELGDVFPGTYRLSVLLPEGDRGWRLQSVTVEGQDALDAPLRISASSAAVISVDVLYSDQHTSLSGNLETSPGHSALDYTVIAFTTNRDWWRGSSRRVQATRPAANGAFSYPDIPPGEYYLAALTDLAPDDWRDSEFLAEIVGAAIKLRVTAGEQKVQDLRVVGGPPHAFNTGSLTPIRGR